MNYDIQEHASKCAWPRSRQELRQASSPWKPARMTAVTWSTPLAGLIWGVYCTKGALKKITTSHLYKGLIAFSSLWTQSTQCNLKPSNNLIRFILEVSYFFLLYMHMSSHKPKAIWFQTLCPASSLCWKERVRISNPT